MHDPSTHQLVHGLLRLLVARMALDKHGSLLILNHFGLASHDGTASLLVLGFTDRVE